MKKVVLKLEIHDSKDKQKAMKAVSTLSGIDSIAMDMKEKKLTVIGDVDPVHIVSKLRKLAHTEIVLVGPAKEPEKKKEEPKKDEAKKEEPKKEEPKKEEIVLVGPAKEPEKKKEEPKKDEAKKEEPKKEEKKKDLNENVAELVKAYQAYNPHMTQHYNVRSAEENLNACVIC